MSSEKFVQLEATAVRFYSQRDETAFFDWLTAIPCVESYEGRGLTLYITIRPEQVDEDSLTDLLAIFRRYGIEKGQLAQFDRPEFSNWFRDPDAPWHAEVFG